MRPMSAVGFTLLKLRVRRRRRRGRTINASSTLTYLDVGKGSLSTTNQTKREWLDAFAIPLQLTNLLITMCIYKRSPTPLNVRIIIARTYGRFWFGFPLKGSPNRRMPRASLSSRLGILRGNRVYIKLHLPAGLLTSFPNPNADSDFGHP
jgi:hypothetical protein